MNMLSEIKSIDKPQESKISKLRRLHLMFIEDWWYEIATLMSKDKETYDDIDETVLEYVKNMRIGGQRVKLEWLSLKVEIIKYFKASKLSHVANNNSKEESKDQSD
jgi:hypothetical protein